MAEEKKDFPWVQLIATVGTIAAALIGITPYILKLNTSSASQTPTIVILTLPPAVTTPVPAPTSAPVTTAAETAPVTQTTVVTTVATTGPPAATTLPPGPAIQIAVNTSSVLQGGFVLASGSTDPVVQQVTITLTNSTTFQSAAVPVNLTQGAFQFQIDTSDYAPGDYTITAAVPDTQAMANASFTINAMVTLEPTTAATMTATTTAPTTPVTTSTTTPTTPAVTTNTTTLSTPAPTTPAPTTPATTSTTTPTTPAVTTNTTTLSTPANTTTATTTSA